MLLRTRGASFCAALGKLTGQPVKWNLSFYGRHVSSHGPQVLKTIVARAMA